MGTLIERHGGIPYAAPVLQEIYLKDSPELIQLIGDICRGRSGINYRLGAME